MALSPLSVDIDLMRRETTVQMLDLGIYLRLYATLKNYPGT